MRHPLWLLNSSLLILLLITISIVVLTQQKVPRWVSIEPAPYIKTVKKEVSEIEMAKIYTNDLFSTYSKPEQAIVKKQMEQAMPTPPSPQPIRHIEPIKLTFLEPLGIALKGIIIMADEFSSRIIVANNKTKAESTLKIGDKIEDAQLIRIIKNKAIFMRSNGQEEAFYLREKDAKEDQGAQTLDRWEHVIRRLSDNKYQVDPEEFIEYVPDLGQFITSLDLITVYRKGKPFGLHVGAMDPASFGHEFGLRSGDIIRSINGIDATSIKNRMEIYNKVASLEHGQSIDVEYLRNSVPISLSIVLENIPKPSVINLGTITRPIRGLPVTEEDIKAEKMKILHEKKTFAPTLDEIRMREKRTILNKVTSKQEAERALHQPVNLEI